MRTKLYLSTSEVARYCHVTPDTVRSWAKTGQLKVFKTPGGHRRVDRDALLQFLEDHNMPIAPDLRDLGTRVLVADTEAAAVETIKQFLRDAPAPFHVRAARNLYETGLHVARFQPDVVFFSLNFGIGDPIGLCERIKEDAGRETTSIIGIVHPDDGKASLDAAARCGAVAACLEKPISEASLRHTLAKAGVSLEET